MATVSDLLQSLMREAGDRPPDPVLALDWLSGRYAEVLERVPWSFMSKESFFNTVASISAGTVIVNENSTTVTETTSNANGWSSSIVGLWFRVRGTTEFYEITAYNDANPDTITLDRGYEHDNDTAATYDIWQRHFSLASDVRYVSSMFVDRDPPTPLDEVSQTDLDIGFPNRPDLASPLYWASDGKDSSNLTRVELYPIPDERKAIHYRYIQSTPSLANGSTTILPQVQTGLMRAGWMSDYWGWRGASSDAPSAQLLQSQKYEQEFQKRLTEMIARECLALPPKRIRMAKRFQHPYIAKFQRNIAVRLD